MIVVGNPQFFPSLNSIHGPELPDAHFNTPYPDSSGRGLFVQINKQHPFESKGIRKLYPIMVNPLTIKGPQVDTFPHLHSYS